MRGTAKTMRVTHAPHSPSPCCRAEIVKHGYLAVDGFFVLTGYLLGLSLLNHSESKPFNLRQ